jgi:hypothetical protein
VTLNANGGCDIARIPGGVLGTAAIVAQAKYPFEPVTARPVNSNVIAKTVTSRFEKSITCFPKGTQPEEQNAAICVARALDITGAPFVGETVCFFADFNAEDIQQFFGPIPTSGTPPIVIGETTRNAAAEAQGLRRICPRTDANGRAAVEIFNTNPTTVDVSALFVEEGILRHILVRFPITATVGPATGVASVDGASSAPTGNAGTTTPGTSAPSGSTPSGSQPSTSAPARYTIARVKLVRRMTKTKARVQVRVNGPAGKAALRLRIAGGSRAITSTARVQTNRLVTLTVRTPSAKRLRVSASLVT